MIINSIGSGSTPIGLRNCFMLDSPATRSLFFRPWKQLYP